ncbi:hypothetical protein EDE08_11832 [Bradyrhizobium sp. R2.2-H]|jgi:hypothetical protein|uniref:hypothetical protein n=1 Tax=unclassified Bradyrhizobium TaxID=2631580 RepID=UPI001043526B|nr:MULTISPECIES: hypothetical protein [unclassified Bradyrhizobium]TCU63814.1 hypothetical protein EDE10_11899 [Bradyrhizobium sp. Y-H1]TCU65674.1 hypothetical protein EDE08_11832 [Bradyrhizobium sp. R2.2-H]
MTETGDTAANASKAQEIKAGLVRLLSGRIREISDDPQQMRDIVYELARVKLLEQFTPASAWEARELQQVLERAIREVERSFERDETSSSAKASATVASNSPQVDAPPDARVTPPPIPTSSALAFPTPFMAAETARRPVASPRSPDHPKQRGAFNSPIRLTAILLLIAGAGTAIVSWPRLRTQLTALSQVAPPSERAKTSEPQPTTSPSLGETLERTPENPKEPAPIAHPSMPLPTTFGVYALSEGQLHELKPVPGKIPDRRVAISAAINAPSVTTLPDGDVKFIVFRPDGGVDAGGTEVRVIAKVSRSMAVDATGKAAMVSAGDSWVIRSMSYPYKVGPIDDQSRMLLLQPEQDGFALAPGRYIVVVKGMGYDFTVAGTITDPNQCVERINAANGAFYSPCPPPRR